jgi:ATP-dependent exoDNAse (exonuclease V) alpha subunit
MIHAPSYFDFPLKNQQQDVFNSIIKFIEGNYRVLILKGYAGTGKTTLVGGLIKWLDDKEKPFELLASTGRAAKILSDKSKFKAKTIHSKIYKFNELDEDLEKLEILQTSLKADDKGQLNLLFELRTIQSELEIIYIIDESSMISDIDQNNNSFAKFGSGQLLTDLFNYDKKGKLIFIGDPLQLPPISQSLSPALSKSYLETNHGIKVEELELTEIIRQDADNGIVGTSLKIRKLYQSNPSVKFAKFPFRNQRNITICNSQADLINSYILKLQSKEYENSTLICQTNKHCANLNNIIRMALGRSQSGIAEVDLIMVTQNNYLTGLVNGDLVLVKEIGKREVRCGLSFVLLEVEELVNKKKYRVILVEDILDSVGTNLNSKQHKDLFIDYYNRMKTKNIKQSDTAFAEGMMTDPYLNSLKGVYGYALTCHKSQGGRMGEYLFILRQ